MLMIRLERVGRVHEPMYRLVLTDRQNAAKSGKFVEILGNYDARQGEKAVFKEDRIKYWISVGAQTSDTVHNLLVDKKIISGKKVNKLPKKSAPKVETPAETAPEASTPTPEVTVEPAVDAPVADAPVAEEIPVV